MKLEGKVVVITGAASGIGRASAARFAARGAVVHLVDLDGARVEEAAHASARRGARAVFHQADCRDAAAVRRVADEVFAREGRVDVLFLNAGVGYGGRIADMSLDDWRAVLDTNVYGVVHGLDAFLRPMVERKGGHVLITASMLGLFAAPFVGAYAASKHALIAIAESLRAELGASGVEVTALCPGLVGSEIVRKGRVRTRSVDPARLDRIWQTRGVAPDVIGRAAVDCVERRRGGVRVVAPTGAVLWRMRRFTPRLYEWTLGLLARAVERFD